MRIETFTDRYGYEQTVTFLVETSDLGVFQDIEATVGDVLDGWFQYRRTVPAADFIDQFCKDTGYEIDRYDDPAAKRILSIARRLKRESND